MSRPRLAVMETASWYPDDQITSIRAMFRILAQLENEDPNSFLYSSFVDGRSFKSTLEYFVAEPGIRYIYIGSHGSAWTEDRLDTPAGDEIGRRQILRRLNKRRVRGVFLSCCDSGNIARYIAERAPYNTWVAGYGGDVNWIKSCAFEMLFWRAVLRKENKGFGKRKTIKETIRSLQKYADLRNELSFSIWVRQESSVVDLLT